MANSIQLEQTLTVPANGKVSPKGVKGRKARTPQKPWSKRPRRKKMFLITLFALAIITVGLTAAAIYTILIPAQKIVGAAQHIVAVFDNIKEDLNGKDLSSIDEYFSEIQVELANINTEIDRYKFLDEIELTRGYYQNLQVVQKLSSQVRDLLNTALPEFKVVLESLGYTIVKPPVVEGEEVEAPAPEEPAEEEDTAEKLKAVIRELPRLVSLYDELEPQILEVIETFNDIDPNYIPSVGVGEYRNAVIGGQKLTLEFPEVSARVKELFQVLPTLLGSDKPARYLVVFQNEKEMRASSGLISAFAILTVDKGELNDDIVTVDTWELESYVSYTLGIDVGYRNIYGQRLLMERGCGSHYLRAQDSGIYPDLSLVMDMFTDYYDIANRYNPSTFPDYDHVIIINTLFASDFIQFVEPLEVEGGRRPITASNVAKEIFADTRESAIGTNRKSYMGEVATAVQEKFNELPPEIFPDVLLKLINTIQAKNIAMASKDAGVQAFVDDFGLGARVEKNFAGDYFQLSEAQVCALKANFYLYDKLDQDIHINENGSISKVVKVTWFNDRVYDLAEDYGVLSDAARYQYRGWIRFFTPPGTQFSSSTGYEQSRHIYRPQTYYDDKMQKEVSDNVIWWDYRRREGDPVRTYDLTVSYALPDSLKYNQEDGYRVLIQKHPGKAQEEYNINVYEGGKVTNVNFRLRRDIVLNYKDGIITLERYDNRLADYADMLEQVKVLLGTSQE